jgi:hypothetical protein
MEVRDYGVKGISAYATLVEFSLMDENDNEQEYMSDGWELTSEMKPDEYGTIQVENVQIDFKDKSIIVS